MHGVKLSACVTLYCISSMLMTNVLIGNAGRTRLSALSVLSVVSAQPWAPETRTPASFAPTARLPRVLERQPARPAPRAAWYLLSDLRMVTAVLRV